MVHQIKVFAIKHSNLGSIPRYPMVTEEDLYCLVTSTHSLCMSHPENKIYKLKKIKESPIGLPVMVDSISDAVRAK